LYVIGFYSVAHDTRYFIVPYQLVIYITHMKEKQILWIYIFQWTTAIWMTFLLPSWWTGSYRVYPGAWKTLWTNTTRWDKAIPNLVHLAILDALRGWLQLCGWHDIENQLFLCARSAYDYEILFDGYKIVYIEPGTFQSTAGSRNIKPFFLLP